MKILLLTAMLGLWELFVGKSVHEPALEPEQWTNSSSRIEGRTLVYSFPGNPEPGVSIFNGDSEVYEAGARILAVMYYDYEAAGSFEPAECAVRLSLLRFELDEDVRPRPRPFASRVQRELGYEPMPANSEGVKTVTELEGRSGPWTKISFADKVDPSRVEAECYYQPAPNDSFLSLCAFYKFTLPGDPPRLARRRAMLDEIARKIEFQPSPPGEAPPATP